MSTHPIIVHEHVTHTLLLSPNDLLARSWRAIRDRSHRRPGTAALIRWVANELAWLNGHALEYVSDRE